MQSAKSRDSSNQNSLANDNSDVKTNESKRSA